MSSSPLITAVSTTAFPTTTVLGTTTISTTVTTTAASTTTSVDALLKLCLLWSVLNKPELQRFGEDPDFPEVPSPPLICNDYFLYNPDFVGSTVHSVQRPAGPPLGVDLDEDEARGNQSNRKMIHKIDHKYSSRSFAVIGALAGIVFILLIMALTTCIRHRRELYLTEDPVARERSYARELLINHIRQFRSTASAERRATSHIDPPPSYDDVIKVTLQPDPTNPSGSTSDRSSVTTDVDVIERSVIVSQADDLSGCQPPSYQEAVAASMTSLVIDEVPPSYDEPNVKRCEGVTTIQIE